MPSDAYSIVVTGAMNPRLHHPYWYRHFEVVTDEECAAAMLSGETISSAAIAQWVLPTLHVICLPDRWEVQALDASVAERAFEVAARTFELLDHTPTTAYGYNFNFHRET